MQRAPALGRGIAACLGHSGARDCAQLPGHDISPMVISRLMTFTSRLIRSLSCCMSSLLGSGLTIEPYVIESGAVAQFLHARLLGAVIAAEHPAALLQAVADDAHAATRAGGRECMDRAFEAVERMGLASRHDLKGFVVVIAARVAFSHGELLFERLNGCPLLLSLSSPGGSRSVRWRAVADNYVVSPSIRSPNSLPPSPRTSIVATRTGPRSSGPHPSDPFSRKSAKRKTLWHHTTSCN